MSPVLALKEKLLNISESVFDPALLAVILVTLAPTDTLSSVLLSVYPCAK